MTADRQQITADCHVFAGLLDAADEIIVRSPQGTDLRFSPRRRGALGDDGLYASEPGAWGNLPAGETYSPLEGTGEWTLVVPAGWCPDLAKNLTLRIKNGQVIAATGGGSVGDNSRRLLALGRNDPLHRARRNLAELGIGTNPNAHKPDNVL
jgi:leucyl aminopeptidase (aminopeptidase T)